MEKAEATTFFMLRWELGKGICYDLLLFTLNFLPPILFHHQTCSLPEEFEWVRALALSSTPVLFNKAEPTDACQGQLGDTWLIAAIAAVAEYPNYLKETWLLASYVFLF